MIFPSAAIPEPRKTLAPIAQPFKARLGERSLRSATGLADVRGRSLLLIGFAVACAAELLPLDVEDVSEHVDGLRILARRSQMDEAESATMTVGLRRISHPATCPVRNRCPSAPTSWPSDPSRVLRGRAS